LSAPSKEKQKKTGTDDAPQKNSAIYSAKCTAKQCTSLHSIAKPTCTNDNKNADSSKSSGIKKATTKTTNPFLRCDTAEMKSALNMSGASAVEVFAELRRRKDIF